MLFIFSPLRGTMSCFSRPTLVSAIGITHLYPLFRRRSSPTSFSASRTTRVLEPRQIIARSYVPYRERRRKFLRSGAEQSEHRLVPVVETTVVDEICVGAVLRDDVDGGAFDALDHELRAALAQKLQPHTAVALAERFQRIYVETHIQPRQFRLRKSVHVALVEQTRAQLIDKRYSVAFENIFGKIGQCEKIQSFDPRTGRGSRNVLPRIELAQNFVLEDLPHFDRGYRAVLVEIGSVAIRNRFFDNFPSNHIPS